MTTLTLVTEYGRNSPIAEDLVDWAESISALSDGAHVVNVFFAGELVGALETFDAVSTGQTDMALLTPLFYAGQLPAVSALGLPGISGGGVAESVALTRTLTDGIPKQAFETYALNVLSAAYSDPYVLLSGSELPSTTDLRGQKIVTDGLTMRLITEVGGSPVLVPASERYAALQTGVIDGLVVPAAEAFSRGYVEIVRDGFAFPGNIGFNPRYQALVINDEVAATLPADLADLLATTTGEAFATRLATSAIARHEAAIAQLVEAGTVRILKEDDLQTWQANAATVADRIMEEQSVEGPTGDFDSWIGAFEAELAVVSGPPVRDPDGDEMLSGTDAPDTINGGAGDDTIDGGAGADLMIGGQGADVIYVDDATDRVSESRKWAGTDTVVSSVDFRTGNRHIENVTLTGEAVVGAGNGLRNTITGNDGENILDGGKNVDTLIGGLGDDIYLLRAPGDNAVETADGGIDTVRSFGSFKLDAHVEKLFMQTVRGKDGSEVQFNGIGNELDNTIVGTPFDNTIVGREGSDSMRGQAGADTFVFDREIGTDVDQIVDFNTNEAAEGDILKLKQSEFAGLATGTLAAAAFHSGTSAADADDRILFDRASGQMWFDADGNGSTGQTLIATFLRDAVVTAADIEVF